MSESRSRLFARVTVPAAVAVLTVLAATATPAGAARPASDGGLFLTVSDAQHTWVRGIRLVCPDTRGDHPHGTAACDALTWARGDLNALRGEPHACTKEYDPVTVTATGTWRGGSIDWHRDFPSACTMDSATGPVFRF
ncbi:SSI family serine proteinase inhibitor [Streptomyces sp. NPDC048248]|uniref:SSI family serine proteinase inhibitor n=1 Tax=Streptomyces sp. NPDC048248 TaxID=3365523 RepID=UPI00372307FC